MTYPSSEITFPNLTYDVTTGTLPNNISQSYFYMGKFTIYPVECPWTVLLSELTASFPL